MLCPQFDFELVAKAEARAGAHVHDVLGFANKYLNYFSNWKFWCSCSDEDLEVEELVKCS